VAVAQDTVRVGIHSGQQNTDYAGYQELWKLADESGLDWASTFDHFLPIQSDPNGPCFEGITLLAALAAQTRNVACGLLVVGATYRHPAVLAKMAATIDHVSGGRLELGIGAAWYELEHAQYGIPFMTVRERLERLRETAHVLRSLWDNETTTFDGKYFQLKDARAEPKPLQSPLPLWIGGGGERVLLNIVAQHASGWHAFVMPEEDYRRKLDALEGHCKEYNRDPLEIRRSLGFAAVLGETEAEVQERMTAIPPNFRGNALIGTPEQCVERLALYKRMGARDFTLLARPPGDKRTIELLATQVAPALRAA
jgi:F420-dependent oxidoreductase-like protein